MKDAFQSKCLVTFARASARWRFSSGGVPVQDLANVPNLDYDPITLAARGLLVEEARTNAIRNSSMAGAAAGTPGTLPTNWTYTSASGLPTQIVGTGTINGIPYVDIRIFGTSTAAAGFSVTQDVTTTQAASTGQSCTGSAYVALVGGSLTNVSGFNLYVQYGESAQSTLESGTQPLSAISATFARYVRALTSTVAGAAYVRSFINFSVASGVAVDLTLRIGAPSSNSAHLPHRRS